MTEKKKVAVKHVRAHRRGKNLSHVEKAEAIALWKAGSVTLDQLADKFQRDRTTFIRLFNNEEVTKGIDREELDRRAAEAVAAAAVNDAVIQAQRIRETKDENYRISQRIRREGAKIMINAERDKVAIGTKLTDLKALHVLACTIKVAREECYAVLGLNEERHHEDDPMPDLVVKELTADEIKDMHNTQLQAGDEDALGALGPIEGFDEMPSGDID